jgi:hypothetical protein
MRNLTITSVAAIFVACSATPKDIPPNTRVEPLGRTLPLPGLREQAIAAPVEDPGDFAHSMAVFEDVAAISSSDYPSADEKSSGAVFPYAREQSEWVVHTPVSPPTDAGAVSGFGTALAISNDFLVVSGKTTTEGGVWIYTRANNEWAEEWKRVKPPDNELADQESFGTALALDGNILLIGSPKADGKTDGGDTILDQGAVYVYSYDEKTAEWTSQPTLRPTDGGGGSLFGFSIALRGDLMVVGAPAAGVGSVRTFVRTADTWVEEAPLQSGTGGFFGLTIALGEDHLAVGAPYDGAGSVYGYTRAKGGWRDQKRLNTDDGEEGDLFGYTLGFSSNALFVGAPAAAVDDIHPGRVQAFAIGGLWEERQGRLFAEHDFDLQGFGSAMATVAGSALFVGAGPSAFAYSNILGIQCTADTECESMHCSVEGVCCDAACTGLCESCLAEIQQTKKAKTGVCQPIASGTDPREGCGSSPPGTCGLTGSCDGAGACEFEKYGSRCGDVHCDSSVSSVGVSVCDGKGQCEDSPSVGCAKGYECRGGSCKTSCFTNDDCDTSREYYCLLSTCVSGARCSADSSTMYDSAGTPKDCGRFTCRDGGCLDTCLSSEDCASSFSCDLPTGQCVPESCTETADCAAVAGIHCSRGKCLSGRGCSDDRRTAYDHNGLPSNCTVQLCLDGQCLSECESTSDCSDELFCDPVRHTCVSSFASKPNDSGCSFGSAERIGDVPWPTPLLMAALVAAAAIDRRRKQAS